MGLAAAVWASWLDADFIVYSDLKCLFDDYRNRFFFHNFFLYCLEKCCELYDFLLLFVF